MSLELRAPLFNPFLTNVPILYLLKIPENLWFSDAFRRYNMETLAENGLRYIKYYLSAKNQEHVIIST